MPLCNDELIESDEFRPFLIDDDFFTKRKNLFEKYC